MIKSFGFYSGVLTHSPVMNSPHLLRSNSRYGLLGSLSVRQDGGSIASHESTMNHGNHLFAPGMIRCLFDHERIVGVS